MVEYADRCIFCHFAMAMSMIATYCGKYKSSILIFTASQSKTYWRRSQGQLIASGAPLLQKILSAHCISTLKIRQFLEPLVG